MPDDDRDDDERVSLDGLDPQQALKALLAVDPDAKPVEAPDRPDADPDGAEDDRPG